MKKFVVMVVAATMVCSCDLLSQLGGMIQNPDSDSNPDSEATLGEPIPVDAEQICGEWKVVGTKYHIEEETVYGWTGVDTYFEFDSDMTYSQRGHWGEKEGTFAIMDTKVMVNVGDMSYATFQFFSVGDEYAIMQFDIHTTGMTVIVKCQKARYAILDQINPSVVSAYVAHSYMELRNFILTQHFMEYNAINNQRTALEPESSLLRTTWNNAYTAIKTVNNLISVYKDYDSMKSYVAHARAIRAFLYYNKVVLWGDVPYADENHDYYSSAAGLYHLPRTSASDVLDAEIKSVTESLPYLENVFGNETDLIFNKDAVNLLLAEMYMYQKNYQKASGCIAHTGAAGADKSVIFAAAIDESVSIPGNYNDILLNSDPNSLIVYSYSTRDIYKKEAALSSAVEDIAQEWAGEPQYGYWAALNRAGKAQEVTGCQAHEVLMPIPSGIISGEAYLVEIQQNPGY